MNDNKTTSSTSGMNGYYSNDNDYNNNHYQNTFSEWPSHLPLPSYDDDWPDINSFDYPEYDDINDNSLISSSSSSMPIGKADLHQQQNSHHNLINNGPFATTISLSSSSSSNQQHHHDKHHNNHHSDIDSDILSDEFGLDQFGQNSTTNQNRFVLIIIIIFTIVLITFSTLLSIAIGLCLYRRKRNKLIELHQQQLQEQRQQQQQQSNQSSSSLFDQGKMNDNFSDDDNHDHCIDNDDKIDGEKTTIIDSSFTETFPLDNYSTAGVFILDKTRSNNHHPSDSILSNNHHFYQQQQQQQPHHPLMIYRDFVSTLPPPPSSSTSPATSMIQHQSSTMNILNPLVQQSQQQQPTITSEFLYQPAGNTSGFLDLAVDRGNVQLIPSSISPPHLQPTSMSSYLTFSNIEQQQQQQQTEPISSSSLMFTTANTNTATINNNLAGNQSISEV